MAWVTICAYALGAALGVAVSRGGPRLQRDWPIYLRTQTLITAATLGIFAAWRLTAPRELIAPAVVSGVSWTLLVAAVSTRGERSAGEAALESWAAGPNGAFWVLPIAGALVGAPAIMIAAIANMLYGAPNFVCIYLMRRDAPRRQRHATSWVDQSAMVVLVAGLLLRLSTPAPTWSNVVLNVSAPVLAFTGAGLVVGSAIHPHNVDVQRGAPAVRRWLQLAAIRCAFLLPVVVISHNSALRVVAMLSALGAPSFSPVQLSVLYGYRSGMVNVAVRWGWIALPIGLGVAALLT